MSQVVDAMSQLFVTASVLRDLDAGSVLLSLIDAHAGLAIQAIDSPDPPKRWIARREELHGNLLKDPKAVERQVGEMRPA